MGRPLFQLDDVPALVEQIVLEYRRPSADLEMSYDAEH
jgi:hypothetical protein